MVSRSCGRLDVWEELKQNHMICSSWLLCTASTAPAKSKLQCRHFHTRWRWSQLEPIHDGAKLTWLGFCLEKIPSSAKLSVPILPTQHNETNGTVTCFHCVTRCCTPTSFESEDFTIWNETSLDASQESCNTKLCASCRLRHGRIQPLYKIFTFMSLHVLCNRHFLSVQRKGVQTLFVLRAPSGIHLSWVAGAECCPWTASRLATHLMGHQLELLLNQNCEMAHLQDTTQFLRQIPCSK